MIEYFERRLAIYRHFSTPSPLALAAIAGQKFFGRSLVRGRYEGRTFFYRCSDVEALKEVLLSKEYDFLGPYVTSFASPAVLDVGHHIGTFSLWATARNPAARILGVEADPNTYKIAAKNAERGRKAGSDWSVLHGAAWKDDEVLSFVTTGHTMSHKVSPQGRAKVQGISLNALLERMGGHADLLKVDIEGAEESFLCATPEALDKVGSAVVEIHPDYCSEARVMDVLRSAFVQVRPMGRVTSSKPVVWCTR